MIESADNYLSGSTLLFIGGSTVNQMIVVNSLEKSGALLHVAVNAEEGLKLSETIQPDLILLDVIMPDIDGFEVCRWLKANAATHDIPVIFITSQTDIADKVRGFEVGGVDYITTPLQSEEFKTRLATHLRVLKQQRQKEANNSSLMEEIDKRERLEQTLLEQSEFQQSLLNAINDMGLQIWVIEGGRVVYVGNHKTANACGCTEKTLKEHPPLADFIHPDDRERVLAYYRRHLSGEPVPSSYEAALTMPGHGRREYEISLAKIPQSDPVRVVSIGKDITERKKMEMELHQREEAFRAMAENTPDTIARYDLECRRIYSNPSLENLIEGAWLSGKTPVETNSLSDSSVGYLKALEEAMETGREVEYTLRWQASGDRIIWSQIRIIPERDAQGCIMSVLAIGRDITELVETEQRQQDSQKLLRKLLMHQEA
ncbi:PAS domain S-box protein, partial [Gynuella sp.]|uniref:PAS domain S-box protein n=1 Tax=Gynuella sp. TaxID=2969146 RepID=UPI003D0B4038